MLVIRRRDRESVTLFCPGGVRIDVTVHARRDGSVHLAFDAKTDCAIIRSELLTSQGELPSGFRYGPEREAA